LNKGFNVLSVVTENHNHLINSRTGERDELPPDEGNPSKLKQ
jgi:hypothetical protein